MRALAAAGRVWDGRWILRSRDRSCAGVGADATALVGFDEWRARFARSEEAVLAAG